MEIKKKIKNKVYTCLFGEGTLTWMKYMRLCYSMFNNGKILCTPNPPPGCPLYCVQLGLLCIKASVQYINFWEGNIRYNIISRTPKLQPYENLTQYIGHPVSIFANAKFREFAEKLATLAGRIYLPSLQIPTGMLRIRIPSIIGYGSHQ